MFHFLFFMFHFSSEGDRMTPHRTTIAALLVLVALAPARADGPRDNLVDAVRRIPGPGIQVGADDRKALEEGLNTLKTAIEALENRKDARTAERLPDVRVLYKAVHDALTYDEFFAPRDIIKAKELLVEGNRRAAQLQEGTADWTTQKGLVVRGYVSKIDGSVQPYGLVIPESYSPSMPTRLDVWFHGRGETLSEVNFLDERRKQPGQFTPANTIVLHPYGRYCNAFKFAGEVDVLEAIESVRKNYRIDDDRISVRGFSMGGAACWQFAVHYADRWFAANPGAGFAETPQFLKIFQNENVQPTWYEKALWHMYDCTDYAVNLRQCPTVAYSGELDSQKQAADIMAEALKAEGIDLLHVIGPRTKHAYHPEAKAEVERRMESVASFGRGHLPDQVKLVTYTLKYNRINWVTVDCLGEHWKKARVDAEIVSDDEIIVSTENVRALTLEFPSGWSVIRGGGKVTIRLIDKDPDAAVNNVIEAPGSKSDRSWRCSLERSAGLWTIAKGQAEGLRKRHDLQGPIDDAFMDSFVFVRPTGTSKHPKFQAWAEAEQSRAIEHWRRQFRGEARVKDDTAITDQEIASANLVLWGDPESNAVLKRIADKLPIAWKADTIQAGDRSYSADDHALILIYPNPLNPDRYVVLNSGFTYREYDYLNNARQVPKLPDWAIIDLKTPPNSRYPGKVAAAGFFGEDWQLRPNTDRR
jgi:hypothetical protein